MAESCKRRHDVQSFQRSADHRRSLSTPLPRGRSYRDDHNRPSAHGHHADTDAIIHSYPDRDTYSNAFLHSYIFPDSNTLRDTCPDIFSYSDGGRNAYADFIPYSGAESIWDSHCNYYTGTHHTSAAYRDSDSYGFPNTGRVVASR
jgi:hypothetical protein